MRSDFLLSEARASLSSTIDDANSLAGTAATVAGVYTAALGACGGVLVQAEGPTAFVWAASITGLHLLIFLIPLVMKALRPRPISHPGGLAGKLSDPKFDALDHEELVRRQALSYDSRIEANAKRNSLAGAAIYRAMIGLTFCPITFVGAILVFRWLT